MWRTLTSRFSSAHGIALLALVIAIGGVAIARIPGPDGEITACYKKQGGDVRLISESKKCGDAEKRIQWSQRGPKGATGLKGADAAVTARDTQTDFVFTKDTGAVSLGGPSVTVNVPATGAFVLIAAESEVRLATSMCSIDPEVREFADFLVYRDGQYANVDGQNCSSTFVRRQTTAVDTAPPGTHTYEMRYHSDDPSIEAQFKNRHLRVSVIK
jgi:hypothetical protein